MRGTRAAAVAAALVISATGGVPLLTTAQADVTDLYVDNSRGNCSDTAAGAGNGTWAPFCTISAAAKVVQPGQTVHVATGFYDEEVDLSRSGTPTAPITFTGPALAGPGHWYDLPAIGQNSNPTHAFSLSGVHDVVVKNFQMRAGQETVLVRNSSRVTLDGLRSLGPAYLYGTVTSNYPDLRITGQSSQVTVSRSSLGSTHSEGLVVDPGVSQTVITTNGIGTGLDHGILATDAPGTVITGNDIGGACGPAVELAGNSSGSTIENNVLTVDEQASPTNATCAASGRRVDLAVSAASSTGTKAAYNVVQTTTHTPYAWAGQTYADVPSFQQASGQGQHDLSATAAQLAAADSPAIDSADAAAPGELDTDAFGQPRVDDPLVPNTGTGVGYYDRGSAERTDPVSLSIGVTANTVLGHTLEATLTSNVSAQWGPISGTVDFGDGSPVLSGVTFPVNLTHTYADGGTYAVTVTATDAAGIKASANYGVTVNPTPPIQPGLELTHSPVTSMDVTANWFGTSSPWPLTKAVLDFGDGTPAVVTTYPGLIEPVTHHYAAAPGNYTVTLTVTDDHGRSATRTQSLTVVSSGVPVSGRWAKGQPTSVGVFNDGAWALRATTQPGSPMTVLGYGQAGDRPTTGDWDGAGHDQIGIYRSGVFALRHDDGSTTVIGFGADGDVPVPGYWDHNGHAQLAIYRPSIMTFAVRHDDGSVSTAALGDPGDIPVVGDWDGVGHTQMGIMRRVNWSANVFALRHDDGTISTATYGCLGDWPVAGDWSGVGRTTYGIYRPESVTFALSNAYVGKADSVF